MAVVVVGLFAPGLGYVRVTACAVQVGAASVEVVAVVVVEGEWMGALSYVVILVEVVVA